MTTVELDQMIEEFRTMHRQLDLAERYFRAAKLGATLASLEDVRNGTNAAIEKIADHKGAAVRLGTK